MLPLYNGMRNKHIFVIDFLLSGKTPGDLLFARQTEQARWVVEFIRLGPRPDLALTDARLFAQLRGAITKLMLKGWI